MCRDEHGLSRGGPAAVNEQLRAAKLDARTDVEVLTYLEDHGYQVAIAVERRRQAERRLTYDDMLRVAELILANDAVADLYRNHFAAVVVDEFQDLTPQQLRVVQRFGHGRTSYAGDIAQGIYGFTGAQPERVLDEIKKEVTKTITFTESHRSAPAVLAMVNAMAHRVGGQVLTCARPDAWPGGGVAAIREFPTEEDEADWIYRNSRAILTRAPRHRIAVMTRTASRRSVIDQHFEDQEDLAYFRWDRPFVDKGTVQILRKVLTRANATAAANASSVEEFLWTLADGDSVQEPSAQENLRDAIAWASDEYADGTPFNKIINQVRAVDAQTVLTQPGIHLLNGHVGKGQQFDWVFVVGLEEGMLPFFAATTPGALLEEARVLTVMLSRARHGVVVTHSSRSTGWDRQPSRFLHELRSTPDCLDAERLRDWLTSSDWAALRAAVVH